MIRQCTLLLSCLFLLPGCGSVNTVSSRTSAPADELHDTQSRINDVLTEIFLHCTGASVFKSEPSGLLKAQIIVANDGFTTRTFAWRTVWLDTRGNQIESHTNVWEGTSVPTGASVTLTSLAPTLAATDFTFELRRSDSF